MLTLALYDVQKEAYESADSQASDAKILLCFLWLRYKYIINRWEPLRKQSILFISMETTIDTKSTITLFDRANS